MAGTVVVALRAFGDDAFIANGMADGTFRVTVSYIVVEGFHFG